MPKLIKLPSMAWVDPRQVIAIAVVPIYYRINLKVEYRVEIKTTAGDLVFTCPTEEVMHDNVVEIANQVNATSE